jgi:hypothetical protein
VEDAPINLFEAAAQAARPSTRAAPAPATGGGSAGTLDYLRNNPQFQQLRQVVQQQPQMLEPILNQLAQGNPELAARISQSPEEFLALLSEDADDDAALPPGAQAISVTEEEREAIERVRVCDGRNISDLSSFAVLDLNATWSSKRTLHATRTRSSPRTSCSTSPRMMEINRVSADCCPIGT